MKKRVGMLVLVFTELICSSWIYLVGGQVAPWIWVIWVFIVAPIAIVGVVVQLGLIIYRTCKKKKIAWNVGYLVLTCVMAYPVSVLCGNSVLTYPRMEEKNGIFAMEPVKEAIALGGKEYKTHAVWPSECYAYDIVKEPYDCNTNKLTDYGIYLADVYAPVSGTVIDVRDTEDDILPNTEKFQSSLGNYMFLEIDETKTYLILAHLEKNSAKVKVGDHVSEGMLLAKVGNSGTTSEPHLHIQHQKDNPMKQKIAICAQGLPITFKEER